jgi:hypothetical protein
VSNTSIQVLIDDVTAYQEGRRKTMRVALFAAEDRECTVDVDIPLDQRTHEAVNAARSRILTVSADFFSLPKDDQTAEFLRATGALV